ncbi:Zn-dependent hydrolase [Schaalia sp. ZJ1691]|uniref:Zn-dependent hydrolase n=1 Tax=Schaalia sp. ZJ1691 TaxID=2709404 RepID=UPI0013EB3D78|nr:Zn-dependent hydrolase [Schaalia sp. ZJ1691]
MSDSPLTPMSVDHHVDIHRLRALINEFSSFGSTPAGGLNRTALSTDDFAVRDHLLSIAQRHGWEWGIDEIGNIFITRWGSDPQAAPVFIGSHLDSQPDGGRFDGSYGVIAGLLVLETLEMRGIVTRRPVTVVDWTNEEGAVFSPSMMGSAVYARRLASSAAKNAVNGDGLSVAEALASWRKLPAGAQPRAPHSYVELHIEQGPILESRGQVVAAVRGVQGISQFDLIFLGQAAHAGTTPVELRRDALVAASRVVIAADQAMREDTKLRVTVGNLSVRPGARNVVPAQASLHIDLRHPDRRAQRQWVDTLVERARKEAEQSGVTVDVHHVLDQAPLSFDGSIIEIIQRAIDHLGLSGTVLDSGAGHDAMQISSIAPTGMIFIPCVGGISHAEAEDITDEWAHAGAEVLFETVVELAR